MTPQIKKERVPPPLMTFKPRNSTEATGENDLTGRTFGPWKVTSYYGRVRAIVNGKDGSAHGWNVECDRCGFKRVFLNTQLKRAAELPIPEKCRHRTSPKVGERFGRLVVVGNLYRAIPRRKKWRCKCDCGKFVEVKSGNLSSGNTRSCGCLGDDINGLRCGRSSNLLGPGLANRNVLLRRYKKGAQRRNILWALTDEQAFLLFEKDCHYCGRPPLSEQNEKGMNGVYLFNGIDRMDSSKGYEIENVITACNHCNFIKSAMPYEEFITWIIRTADHLKAIARLGGLEGHVEG